MSDQATAPRGPGGEAPALADAASADAAYRRAWWSLVAYPLTFVAAFVIGEGLLSWLDDGIGDPALWAVIVAATPALVVFVVPGILAVVQGRKAMRLGRSDGNVPAIIGATIAVGFVGLNLFSGLLQLLLG